MQSLFIKYKSSKIHYCQYGKGDKLLLCFHGYGESGESFGFLEKHIADCSIIAIDFPFHGKTNWNEGMPFSKRDLLAVLGEIFKAGRLTNPKVCLVAYSMGARIALHILEEIPYKIEKVILMAPDGLQKSFWYSLATQNYVGTRLFHFSMNHPGWLFWVLHVCHKFRFINQGFIKFANYYIQNEQMRNALYNRWMAMRRFRPDIKKIKRSVRLNNIQLRLLYGKYDKIIRYQNAEKFMHGIEAYCILSVIESGHQLIQEKNMDAIIRVIKD